MQEDLCNPAVCDNSDFLVGFANSGADLSLWLGRCAAVAPGVWTVPDEVDVVAARELRGALLTLLRAHTGFAAEGAAKPKTPDPTPAGAAGAAAASTAIDGDVAANGSADHSVGGDVAGGGSADHPVGGDVAGGGSADRPAGGEGAVYGSTDHHTSVPAAEAYLRRIAPRHPLVPQISADGCTLVPAQAGVLGVFGAILAAVTNLAYQNAWRRLKVCKNDVCHDAFFDKTRNSSGLYCSAACSSQASMRAYRSRQRAAA